MFDEDYQGDDRLGDNIRRATLPRIWIEHSSTIPFDAADEFWDTPNVYQFARSDCRFSRNTNGDAEFFNAAQTGTVWGESLYAIHNRQYTTWASRWAAISKPFRVLPLFVGPDVADSPIKLMLHPDDKLSNGDVSFYKKQGRLQCQAFFNDAAARYVQLLVANGRPRVIDGTVDDMETFPEVAYGHDNNPTTGFMALNLADARADTVAVNVAGQSANQWLATRTTDRAGNPFPAWDASYNGYHPANWENIRRGDELENTVKAYSIQFAVGDPFRNNFNLPLRHGNWRLLNATRSNPAMFRQTQFRYLMDGDFALGFSIPANYRDIPANPWRAEAGLDGDTRWETVKRTSVALGVGSENQDEVAADFNINLCRSIGAIRGNEPFPSMNLENMPGVSIVDPLYIASRNHMIRWMLDAARYSNAKQFWLHAPLYESSILERARVKDLIATFNARWMANST